MRFSLCNMYIEEEKKLCYRPYCIDSLDFGKQFRFAKPKGLVIGSFSFLKRWFQKPEPMFSVQKNLHVYDNKGVCIYFLTFHSNLLLFYRSLSFFPCSEREPKQVFFADDLYKSAAANSFFLYQNEKSAKSLVSRNFFRRRLGFRSNPTEAEDLSAMMALPRDRDVSGKVVLSSTWLLSGVSGSRLQPARCLEMRKICNNP